MIRPTVKGHAINCTVYRISFCSASYNVDSVRGEVYILNVLRVTLLVDFLFLMEPAEPVCQDHFLTRFI